MTLPALSVAPMALSLLLQPAPHLGTAPFPPEAATEASYTGVGRRDPFSRPGPSARPADCAGGLACLSVDSAELRGTIKTPRGWAALIGSGGRSYLVRPGDSLRDGTVAEVSEIHVSFRQPPVELERDAKTVVKSLRAFEARLP